MSVESANAVRIRRTIGASRQAVWDAWAQPDQMKRWSCPAPDGVRNVTSDFRVGGAYELVMEVDGAAYTAFGVYREIEEPARLAYTWDWREEEHGVGEALVTVEFNEVDGATEVVLVHEGFPEEESKQGHEEGWGACLIHFSALF